MKYVTIWNPILLCCLAFSFTNTCHAQESEEKSLFSSNDSSWISPNGVVELYAIGTEEKIVRAGDRKYDTHQALMIRIKGKKEDGLCLSQTKGHNIYWSPESKYVVVEKEYLTHNCDIDIYEIGVDPEKTTLIIKLIYTRTAIGLPAGQYWTHWDFKQWKLNENIIMITESIDYMDGTSKSSSKEVIVNLKQKPVKTIRYEIAYRRGE